MRLSVRHSTKVAHPFSGRLKIEDFSQEISKPVNSSNRPTGGGDAPSDAQNVDRTDSGDPLSSQCNQGDFHIFPGHITGSGGGPILRSGNRSVAPSEYLIQDYIRFSAKSANAPVPATAPTSTSTSTAAVRKTLFEPNGRPKSSLPHDPAAHNLPQTEHHRTWPSEVGRVGSQWLLNNPLTRMADRGPGHGALAGALALGGLGAIGAGGYNLYRGFRDEDEKKVPFWKTVLMASLGGAGLGALSGYFRSKRSPHSAQQQALWRPKLRINDQLGGTNTLPMQRQLEEGKVAIASEKAAFGLSGDVQAMIRSLQGSGLPFSLIEQLTSILAGLSPGDARALRMAAGGAGGAALGMFLARKFGLGGMMTAGMALAGGLTGANIFGGEMPRRQQLTDLYGRPY